MAKYAKQGVHKMRKSIITFICLAIMVMPSSISIAGVPAEGSSQSSDLRQAINSLTRKINARSDKAPNWLKRTTLNFHFDEGYVPAFELESVQPLYRFSNMDMFFVQLNAKSREWNERYNIGLGYRNIVTDGFILGANAFIDWAELYDHRRYGFGLEALGRKYEARANSYFRMSPERTTNTGNLQKVMGGFDVEVGGSIIPFYEDMQLFAKYAWFNSTYSTDVKKLGLRGTLPISRYLGLEVKYERFCCNKNIYHSNAGMVDEIFAKLSIGLDGPIKGPARTEADLQAKLLQPVEREMDVLVEEKAGAFSVSIKRGDS